MNSFCRKKNIFGGRNAFIAKNCFMAEDAENCFAQFLYNVKQFLFDVKLFKQKNCFEFFVLACIFCMPVLSENSDFASVASSESSTSPEVSTSSEISASSASELPSAEKILRISEEQFAQIKSGQLISVDNSTGINVTHYVPKNSVIGTKLMEAPIGKSGFALASVSLVPYPDSWENFSTEEKRLALYNILGKISTQEGITYISKRAGYKPKTLFTQSYYIENENKKSARLNDIVKDSIPESEVRYVFQEDTSFGENTYRHTYTNSSDEIFVEITNCTAMKYHGVTCLKQEEMRMCFSLYPCREGIVLSSAAIVSGHRTTVTVLFVKVDLSDSFKRRTDAIHEWFKKMLK